MPSSRGSSPPRDRTQFSHTTGRFFTIWATREAQRLPRKTSKVQQENGKAIKSRDKGEKRNPLYTFCALIKRTAKEAPSGEWISYREWGGSWNCLAFVFCFYSQATLLPWQFPLHLVLLLITLSRATSITEAPRDLPYSEGMGYSRPSVEETSGGLHLSLHRGCPPEASLITSLYCRKEDPFQGPRVGPRKHIVWGDTRGDKARAFIGKGWRAVGYWKAEDCSATLLTVSQFLVMGLVSGFSLANHSDSGSFLLACASFSQDGVQSKGFWEVWQDISSLLLPPFGPFQILLG